MNIHKRKEATNPHEIMIGLMGSGKSYESNQEILDILANTDDDIFVIDTTGEYKSLAKEKNGNIINLTTENCKYDILDISYSNDENIIYDKIDFIFDTLDLFYLLSPMQKSIINNRIMDYYNSLKSDDKVSLSISDLCKELNIADKRLQNFLMITNNAKSINMDFASRFIVFDISQFPREYINIAYLIGIDLLYKKFYINKNNKKYTWAYLEDLDIVLKSTTFSHQLSQLWVRARMMYGCMTGIVQGENYLLNNDYGKRILNNTNFLQYFII